MCPENTPEKQREHMDRSCKHFTQEKLDAANKLFNEKRAARTAEYEKTTRPAGSRTARPS